MAPLVLRMALPARPVQMARRTPVRSSRAVRVRANSDELSRIAEIEEEIARQVSWGVVRCSARRLGRFCSCAVASRDSPVLALTFLWDAPPVSWHHSVSRSALSGRPSPASGRSWRLQVSARHGTPHTTNAVTPPGGPSHGRPAALRSCTGLEPWRPLPGPGGPVWCQICLQPPLL
jgi:hypothetical protein